MCHMWADTEEELHAMAAAIGIQRKWFQKPPKASWKHYDISLGKKALAIERGAVLTDQFGPLEYLAKRWIASGDPAQIERGTKQLDMVKHLRELRANPNG